MTASLFSEGVMPDMTLPEDPLWHELVEAFMATDKGRRAVERVAEDVAAGHQVYPPRVFRALDETPSNGVRVVILGQDPYHGPGQAEGLSFSVPVGIRVPPSLRNIKKELQRDLGVPVTQQGSLLSWAHQGVLLLNAILTVRGERLQVTAPLAGRLLPTRSFRPCRRRRRVPYLCFGAISLKASALSSMRRDIWSSVPIIRLRFQRCGRPRLSLDAATLVLPTRGWRRMASSLSIGGSDPCPAELGRAFQFQGTGLGKRLDGNLDLGAS